MSAERYFVMYSICKLTCVHTFITYNEYTEKTHGIQRYNYILYRYKTKLKEHLIKCALTISVYE